MIVEKIVITEEEKKALSIYLTNTDEEKKMELFIKASNGWNGFLKSLKRFTPEQFALLLCDWYEVEQPFKVGDWVYCKKYNSYYKIARITNGEYEIKLSDEELKANFLRQHLNMYEKWEKITEPWKIMLLELGRDKPEFREGDRYITVEDYSRAVTHDDSKYYALETAKENRIKYFYPVESRIEVKGYGNSRE